MNDPTIYILTAIIILQQAAIYYTLEQNKKLTALMRRIVEEWQVKP